MTGGAGAKTFFLGIGAAKSGTSWLYDYLISHPAVAPGPIKEMHVLGSPGNAGLVRAVRGLPWHRFAGRKWLAENLAKAWYRADWDRYFTAYLNRLENGALATGEISTSYMALPAERLTMVKDRFAARGVRVVGILLLRDPVERLISDIRFHKRLSRENRYAASQTEPLEALLRDRLDSKAARMNRDDPAALATLRAVFGPADRIIDPYEALFDQALLDRICATLGLPPHPADLARRVNETRSEEAVEAALRAKAARALAPCYRAAAEEFGADRIAMLWPNAGAAL